MNADNNKFLKRLATGEPLVLAEGYIFELERRGYLQAGAYCPEVLLENPKVVQQLTEDYVNCGSDIIVVCTYYVNKQKLKLIGKDA